MKLVAIQKPRTRSEAQHLDQMHRLRSRVFADRLAWSVTQTNGRELDQFDTLGPTYLLALSQSAEVVGCARLLPASGPTMLEDIFPQLLQTGKLAAHAAMIESSRFCVDTALRQEAGEGALHGVTMAMFAGMVEWCLLEGYSEIATATDIRFERILRRAGWPMRRLGQPVLINETMSVAGVLPATVDDFERLRPKSYQSLFRTERQHAA